MKAEINGFLKEVNDSIVALMEQLEVESARKEEIQKKFRQQCLALLLDSDLLNAESYEMNDERGPSRNHNPTEESLIERSNQMIKRLARQLLEKDEEIERMKGELSANH